MNKAKKNKHKLVAYASIPVLALGALFAGVGSASAHGMFGGGWGGFGADFNADQFATRQQTMFQQEADLLGVSVSDVTQAWVDGKSFQDLATEKGVTSEQIKAKMQTKRVQDMKTGLQALVSKSIITQAQADKRLQIVQAQMNNQAAKNRPMGRRMGRGYGMMFGF